LTDRSAASKGPLPLSLKKRIAFTLVLVSVVGLLALTLAELYVRRTSKLGYVTPEIFRDRSLQYEPALFARFIFPRRELHAYGGEGPDGSVFYHINKLGYRGHEFEPNKPDGKIRIMFYGGSHVFDIWMPEGEDWPHRVERILNQNGFPQVEVINAGVPGFLSFECFSSLWSEGHVFSPDYVVFCCAWNDIKKRLQSVEPLLRQIHPEAADSDPRLNYQGSIDRFLSEHLQLYVRLRQSYYDWKFDADLEGQEIHRDQKFDFDLAEEAVKQYRLNVQLFVDCAKNIGAVPVLMNEARLAVRATNPQQTTDPLPPGRAGETLMTGYERIEQILRDVAREKNTVLLNSSSQLNGREEFFADRVHLTKRGSNELAGLVAQEMTRLLQSENRSSR
jgi:hypothetical protein